MIGSLGLASLVAPFFLSLLPGKKAYRKALPIRVNLSALTPGDRLTVVWEGKPVWIIRRTDTMLKSLLQDHTQLQDPNSLVDQQPSFAQNEYRSARPEYFIVIALCTHLGCVPRYESDAPTLLCPCHGSRFDWAGRVFRDSPAPINLEIPPYRFLDQNTVEIGVYR